MAPILSCTLTHAPFFKRTARQSAAPVLQTDTEREGGREGREGREGGREGEREREGKVKKNTASII